MRGGRTRTALQRARKVSLPSERRNDGVGDLLGLGDARGLEELALEVALRVVDPPAQRHPRRLIAGRSGEELRDCVAHLAEAGGGHEDNRAHQDGRPYLVPGGTKLLRFFGLDDAGGERELSYSRPGERQGYQGTLADADHHLALPGGQRAEGGGDGRENVSSQALHVAVRIMHGGRRGDVHACSDVVGERRLGSGKLEDDGGHGHVRLEVSPDPSQGGSAPGLGRV